MGTGCSLANPALEMPGYGADFQTSFSLRRPGLKPLDDGKIFFLENCGTSLCFQTFELGC